MESNRLSRNTLLAAIAAAVLTLAPFAASAASPKSDPLRDAFKPLAIANLHVAAVDGILIIRGDADDSATVDQASSVATRLGYTRVANLVRVLDKPNDIAIARQAERQLAATRALDGCAFTVDAERGVVRVGGTVRYELQKDVAVSVLRSMRGVLDVQSDLRRER